MTQNKCKLVLFYGQEIMYNLQKKIKEQKEGNVQRQTSDNKTGRISVRDRLLTQGNHLKWRSIMQ